MDEQYENKLAKIAGNVCDLLACMSISFAIFAIMLSFFILYYRVEVVSVVSIMVGIALASFFARLTLFMSHCRDCKIDDVFDSLVRYLGIFSALAIIAGMIVPALYNSFYSDEMCYEAVIGLDVSFVKEKILECHEIQRDIHKTLNGILAGFPIFMIILAVVKITRGILRLDGDKGKCA